MMTEANQHYTYANVPLKGEALRQPALIETMFPNRLYYLPKIVPGQEAFIYDADEWQPYNGKQGTVTHYSYFTGLHTIALELAIKGRRETIERPFLGREIIKPRR